MTTKAQEISRRILDKVAAVASVHGVNADGAFAVRAGIDEVLGEGTYDRLVSDLYDELRQRK